jgi:hypothetical protein
MGTTPTELETKLSQVFELASLWDALVLMDEADIFLGTFFCCRLALSQC